MEAIQRWASRMPGASHPHRADTDIAVFHFASVFWALLPLIASKFGERFGAMLAFFGSGSARRCGFALASGISRPMP